MLAEPDNFQVETTTVWSFRERGRWATHTPDYRGNWAPQVVRNLLLLYSNEDDTVLDPFVGGGTTLIECKLLNRNGIGTDISPESIKRTNEKLAFKYPRQKEGICQRTLVADARCLDILDTESVDFVLMHPPYADIIKYSDEPGDLSHIHDIASFKLEMQLVAAEAFRVLKSGKYCAVLIGDTRRHGHFVPIAFRVMKAFLECSYILKEDIIKHQWQCKSTPLWRRRAQNGEAGFLLLMHEHLFVFRKPGGGDSYHRYGESMDWEG